MGSLGIIHHTNRSRLCLEISKVDILISPQYNHFLKMIPFSFRFCLFSQFPSFSLSFLQKHRFNHTSFIICFSSLFPFYYATLFYNFMNFPTRHQSYNAGIVSIFSSLSFETNGPLMRPLTPHHI